MLVSRPRDIDGALAALGDDPSATLLAGGTDVMVEVNFGRRRPEHVVALRRIDELRASDQGRIGAGVTYAALEKGPYRALAEASRTVGSLQIRAAGTVGGNLGTASPAGDALPFLAAAGAQIELVSRSGGRRVVPWDRFLVGPKHNDRRPDELIVAALLPDDVPVRQAFGKVGVRNAMVIAIVAACVMRDDDGTTRIALGSVAPTTMRAGQAERMISAEVNPSPAALAEFARLVASEVRPITDHRSTEAYRRHASGVLARRLLERCLAA